MKFISRYASHRIYRGSGCIQFVDGVYETKDEGEIDFLQALPEYGSAICGIKDQEIGLLHVDGWSCDICGKSFPTRQGFAAHMRVHK